MKGRRYSSDGIVLASRRFSEADRILVVFSKDFGKLHLIAKGVRKLKSRKRGSLEVFSRIRFAAASGRDLDIVTEVEVLAPFEKIRQDLKRVSVAYFFVETIGRLTKEEEKNEKLFDLLTKYLEKLQESGETKKLRQDFIFDALVLLGYWPEKKGMKNHDKVLEEVAERGFFSVRVGKKVLT